MAPPPAHPRIRQPDHKCITVPATGSARLSGHGHRTGGLGTFHEKRADHRQKNRRLQEKRARAATGYSEGMSSGSAAGAVCLLEQSSKLLLRRSAPILYVLAG